MYKNIFFILFLLTAGCDTNTTAYKPISSGKIHAISVVIDNKLWTQSPGEELKKVYSSEFLGLPQQEPLFTLSQIPPSIFTDFTRESRNIIVVSKSTSGICLSLVDHSSDTVVINHQDTIDESRGHFVVDYNNSPAVVIGDESHGWDSYENLLNQAAVLFSFEQIGGSQASLDMATNYAKERYAFGRQIGSFQAIKHKLADMYVAITLAKSNSYYAAWALSTESSDLPVASATARVSSTKAYQLCSKENIQTHGGNGFTWEYDCHLYYKRSKLLSVNIGSLPNWKEKLVSSLEKSNTY